MQEDHLYHRRYIFRIAITALVFSEFISGCSTQKSLLGSAISPDSNNEVQIVSLDNAGPGQNSESIAVSFKNKYAEDFRDIAVFNSYSAGRPVVKVFWQNNNTIIIKYSNVDIGFQAVKIGEISVKYEKVN